MNIKSILKTIIVGGFMFSLSAQAQPQKMYMAFFEVINMNSQYQYSASRLLQTYVSDVNRYEIILPPKPDSLYPTLSMVKVQEKARSLQAPLFAIGDMNRVGEIVVISFTIYKTDDGSRVWSDRLKANTPDDLDPIMKKLANKMGTAEKANKDDDMYNVTNYDGKELNKIQATNRFGFTLAGAVPITGFVSKGITGIGIAGSYDSRNLLLDIRGMYMFTSNSNNYGDGSASSWIGSLECYYPLNSRNFCPFVGGGFGISSTTVQPPASNSVYGYSYSMTNSGSGLMMMAGGGVILNRNSSVNLRLSGNLFSSFYEINSKYIAGVMLRMEILY